MPTYTTADIRNIAIMGHGGAGKTTLVDMMLFASGAVNRKGLVADGSSFSDFEKEEREHVHSIFSTIVHMDVDGKRINVIDTPGSPDLIGQGLQVLPAVETMVVVINALSGIEVVTRRMMEAGKLLGIPRAIVINRIDLPEVKLAELVEKIQKTFGSECLAFNLPQNGGKNVVDVIRAPDDESDLGPVKAFHAAVMDSIVEMDEDIMEKYLGGDEPDESHLHSALVRAMAEGHIVPIFFTDAKDSVGVKELIDAICKHFPSPLETRPWPMVQAEGDEHDFHYAESNNGGLLAHVFKVTTDPFVGKLALFRVHQGKATGMTQALLGHARKPIKLGHLFHMQGKDHAEAQEVIAGDIAAVAKIEELHAGDILHDDPKAAVLKPKPITYPTPMFGLAITPKARGDEQKISVHLTKLAEEDPTFIWHTDKQTHEIVVNGLGELHLRLTLERMGNRGVHVDTKPPKIAYRETIQVKADGHHRHKKQTGGSGQFGEVFLSVEPLPEDSPAAKSKGGSGLEIVNEIFGGTIPGQFIPAVEKGIHDLMEQGPVAGYPIQDVRVAITDGKHHPVDSKEIAFRTAGRLAFKDAMLKAKPVLLEPIVNMEVTVPEDKMGAITGDLSGKRGRIQGTDMLPGGFAVVKAQAPLSEVMQYQSQLKSVTGGQGSFVMEFSHYEPAPPLIQHSVASAYQPKAEDE